MFNFQDNRYGPGLQRRTYILDPEKYYNITLLQSNEYSYFTYGGFYDNTIGSFVPIQYAGTTLTGVLGSDLGATAWFDYALDYPNGLYHNDTKYKMHIKRDVPPGTEITMVVYDGQKTVNYHTRVEVPTFTIESITDEDTLLHFYSRDIQFRLNFQQSCQLDGYGGAYPVGIKFNVEILQGQEYGNLYYPGTVAEPEQSGTSITNLEDEYGQQVSTYSIRYKADGIQPDINSPGIVTIRCSANDMDILPVEISFPIKYNEDPPDEGGSIIVKLDKEYYRPGDTAIANCKWMTAYNELLDFPAEQRFTVEIIGGSEYGTLQDPITGEASNILQEVSNGFRVITATGILEDSVKIIMKVSTNIGGDIPTAVITKGGSSEETERRIKKDKQKTPEVLVIGGGEIVGYGTVVIKKDECEEEIVVCENNQAQIFNPFWIEKYKNYSYFDYDLSDPLNPNYIVEGCQLKRNDLVQGFTFIMPGMPLGKNWNQSYSWTPQDNVKIKVCLLENENRWLIKFDELRIPIFSSACIEGYTDLGDGTNITILNSEIKSKSDYDVLLNDLKYWEIGPYSQPGKKPQKYVFESGILKHEYKHFQIDSVYVLNTFNKFFSDLFNNWILDKSQYSCPENALSSKEESIRVFTSNEVSNCFLRYDNLKEWEKKKEELKCDKYARQEYKNIREKIKNWAKNKSW